MTVTRLSLSERQIGRPSTADTVSLHRWVQMKRADLVDDLAGIQVTPHTERTLGILAWGVVVFFAVLALVGAVTIGSWLGAWQ